MVAATEDVTHRTFDNGTARNGTACTNQGWGLRESRTSRLPQYGHSL